MGEGEEPAISDQTQDASPSTQPESSRGEAPLPPQRVPCQPYSKSSMQPANQTGERSDGKTGNYQEDYQQ